MLAQEATNHAEIANNRIFKAKLKERLLTDYDHEEEHLKRLQIFFKELAFDEWLELHAAEALYVDCGTTAAPSVAARTTHGTGEVHRRLRPSLEPVR